MNATDRRNRLIGRFNLSHLTNGAILCIGDVLALVAATILGGVVQALYRPDIPLILQGFSDNPAVRWMTLHAWISAGMLAAFWVHGHYRRRQPWMDEVYEILKIMACGIALAVAALYLFKFPFSRSWFLSTWALTFTLVPLVRFAAKHWLLRLSRWQIPTVVIGDGASARAVVRALRSEPLLGFDILGFLIPPHGDEDGGYRLQQPKGASASLDTPSGDIADWLRRSRVRNVVVIMENGFGEDRNLFMKLGQSGVNVIFIPSHAGLPLQGLELQHIFRQETMMLCVRNNLNSMAARAVKRSFDIVASSVLIVVTAPLTLWASLAIRRSGPDVFFSQERIGQEGEHFECLKFRSMVPRADAVLEEILATDNAARMEWKRNHKLRNDPRVTHVGAWLRRFSIDELPQLWNVLRGEMSLVGPRPLMQSELDRYGDRIGYYLQVKPGITGIWQVSGRSDTYFEERVHLDEWYVKNWSLWYDLMILVKTIPAVLNKKGAY